MSYFFLSYAHVDRDPYLDRFFTDLRRELRNRTGLSEVEQTGFVDLSTIELGGEWAKELSAALCTARIFIALYSPSYFTSENCGKEWQAFHRRVRAYQQHTGERPAVLIPVIWLPPTSLPDTAHEIQYQHEDLGTTYAREGLQYLLRINRHQDDYQEFLTRLAQRIIAATERYPLPPQTDLLDFATVPSAFHWPLSDRPTGDLEQVPSASNLRRADPPAGPRHVHFLVAAAVQHEMAEVRNSMYFYGTYPTEWTPYRPGSDRRICAFAQYIVSTQNITSALATNEQDLLGLFTLLERSRVQNEIVILLVDVWTTKIARYHRVLSQYDTRNEPTSGVLLPCSEDDEESKERLEELRDELSRTFPNAVIRRDSMFREFIPNVEAFQRALLEVLVEAQKRIFRQGTVRRRAGGSQIIEQPILPAQGADDDE